MARRLRIHPLQSRSEIVLRNTVVAGLIAFFSVFYLIPILMAFVGSFHLWNPLKGQYRFTGLQNWQMVFRSSLFWQSMGNTALFAAVAVAARLVIGMALALALHTRLIRRQSLYLSLIHICLWAIR